MEYFCLDTREEATWGSRYLSSTITFDATITDLKIKPHERFRKAHLVAYCLISIDLDGVGYDRVAPDLS